MKPDTIRIPNKDNMNPVDYWYSENGDFKQFIDEYGQEILKAIQDKELAADMQQLFNSPAVVDKLQVLSLLSVIKIIEE